MEVTIKLDSTKNPKWIDMTLKVQGMSMTALGIYELKDDSWKFCLAMSDKGDKPATRPTDFTAERGSGRYLAVMKRTSTTPTSGAPPEVLEAKRSNALKYLALTSLKYYDDNGKAAGKIDDVAPMLKDAPDLVAAVRSGTIVPLWGLDPKQVKAFSTTIFAYERDVPTKGGLVVFCDCAVKKLTAQEFAAAPKSGTPTKPDDQPKPPVDEPKTGDGLSLKAEELTRAFFGPDRTAGKRYVSKVLTITGVGEGEEKDKERGDALILKGDNPECRVLCYGLADEVRKDLRKSGKPVTIQGTCEGKSIGRTFADVLLANCKVLRVDGGDTKPDDQPKPPVDQALEMRTSNEGRFSILMPKGQDQKTSQQVTTPVGKITLFIHGIELPGKKGSVVVMYNDYPPAGLRPGADVVLDAAREGCCQARLQGLRPQVHQGGGTSRPRIQPGEQGRDHEGSDRPGEGADVPAPCRWRFQVAARRSDPEDLRVIQARGGCSSRSAQIG